MLYYLMYFGNADDCCRVVRAFRGRGWNTWRTVRDFYWKRSYGDFAFCGSPVPNLFWGWGTVPFSAGRGMFNRCRDIVCRVITVFYLDNRMAVGNCLPLDDKDCS